MRTEMEEEESVVCGFLSLFLLFFFNFIREIVREGRRVGKGRKGESGENLGRSTCTGFFLTPIFGGIV